ncbi:MAG: hypothetical protein Q9222_001229 [Ikaeria aurantiellina]
MALDRSLATLLRALQGSSDEQDINRQAPHHFQEWCAGEKLTVERLLRSVATIYTLLSNPSNVTLLTAQILSAPALWSPSTSLHLVVRVVDIFKLASLDLSRRQSRSSPSPSKSSDFRNKLDPDEWTSAVLKAFDEACPPPRQLLVLAGLLQGHEGRLRGGVFTRKTKTLQSAFVNAVNLSLRADRLQTDVANRALVIAVGQVFDLLDPQSKVALDHDSLYLLVYLAAVDTVSHSPVQAEHFINQIRPAAIGQMPNHPLDRLLDLYFLNTAEHLAGVLSTDVAVNLLILAASPYLGINDDSRLLETSEAGHSLMLATLSAPHNVAFAASRFEDYAKTLFQVYLNWTSPSAIG